MVTIRAVALEDRRALWEWYNDPLRRIAFPGKQSITYTDHCAWFEKIMNDNNTILCVGVVDNLRIGTVRFDQRTNEEYEVSLYLKPAYCGKGYGPQMLLASANYLRTVRSISKLFVDAKKVNTASREIFVRAGFVPVREGEFGLHFVLAL